jgi:NADH:ubiquinone oxidoreductase subunit 6 (subunit J)
VDVASGITVVLTLLFFVVSAVFSLLAFAFYFFFIFLVFGLAVGSIVGTIWALYDCVQREKFHMKGENARLVWILIICFTGLIGAGLYYYLEKKKDSSPGKPIRPKSI